MSGLVWEGFCMSVTNAHGVPLELASLLYRGDRIELRRARPVGKPADLATQCISPIRVTLSVPENPGAEQHSEIHFEVARLVCATECSADGRLSRGDEIVLGPVYEVVELRGISLSENRRS